MYHVQAFCGVLIISQSFYKTLGTHWLQILLALCIALTIVGIIWSNVCKSNLVSCRVVPKVLRSGDRSQEQRGNKQLIDLYWMKNRVEVKMFLTQTPVCQVWSCLHLRNPARSLQAWCYLTQQHLQPHPPPQTLNLLFLIPP